MSAPTNPTGEQLYQELVAEARRRQKAVSVLARKIWHVDPRRRLEQMRCAAEPKPLTVDRIRAVIAGQPVEPATIRDPSRRFARRRNGAGTSSRLANQANARAAVEERLRLSRLAEARRLPGETLERAARRLEMEPRA